MLSLKQLQYALAVEKTLHFKKAAAECSISQSALSTAINELENQLGIQIFERDNKKVLVTPQGKEVLAKARQIKLQVDELYLFAAIQKSPLSLPMTLGIIPTIGPYLLPQVLPELRKQFPDFKLTIVEEQSEVLVELVRNGEIDTAILALPYELQGLLAFKFWQEDFLLVTHKDGDFTHMTSISADQLAASRLLLLKDGHCLKDHALAACKLKTGQVEHNLAGTSLHTLVQMVAGKMGVTLVPQMAIRQLLNDNPELHAISLAEPGPHRSIAFICRPHYAGVSNIDILKKLFKERLEQT